MVISIMNIENEYGDTPLSIAKELADALQTNDSFVLFCYWAEFIKGLYLDDLYNALDMYLHNKEWQDYYNNIKK